MTTAGLEYLYSLTNEYRSIRYDLRNMQALAAALGNPQEAFRCVLIAGTNGKGSVAKLLSSMMPDAGLYTSPSGPESGGTMKRVLCVLLLLMPLAGCAGFDDFTAFGEFDAESPCALRPAVNACGVAQTSGSLPAQTAEPPR